jgi:acyl-ACP thioesterase
MDIWQETIVVRFGDIDPSDRVTMAAVFGYFQEAAVNHAEHLGVGREALGQSKQAWILSRMSVVVERRPRYDERIVVRSWPRGTDRLFAVRNYDIQDEAGAVLVRGISGWLIFDTERRRALRPEPVAAKLPRNEGVNVLPYHAVALAAHDGLMPTGTRQAAYSDIDYNGHVNNARYVQWIADVTDPTLLNTADSIRLDINYIKELKPGETAALLTGEGDDNRRIYEGRLADQAVFRAELQVGV